MRSLASLRLTGAPPGVVLEEPDCPLECRRHDVRVCVGWDRLHDLPGRFAVVRCVQCGLLRTTPRPTPETIGAYYPDDYHPHTGAQAAGRAILSPAMIRRLDSLANALPPIRPGRALELGCGAGGWLSTAREAGWEVLGVEPAEPAAAAARARGHEVVTGRLEDLGAVGEFDLVVAWMVLEHLHDPVAALAKLRGYAAADGWLALSVPNAGSPELRLFGKDWYALDLPRHLYHFTPGSLERVLAAAGWRLERVLYQRNARNVPASIGVMLERWGLGRLGRALREGRAPGLVRLLGRGASVGFGQLFGRLGLSGRMTVWARPL